MTGVPPFEDGADLLEEGDLDDLARAAHEVNRAYCQTIGDISQVPYDEAPEWQKASARAGAVLALDPATTPDASHRSWLEQKVNDGWTYGPVKDPVRKEHPCMVPFCDLPAEQQVKDHLFLATVRAARAVQMAVYRRAMDVTASKGMD